MVKKYFYLFTLFLLSTTYCVAQKEIFYVFDKCVTDSVQKGVDTYVAMTHKTATKLRFYIVLAQNDAEYSLYLQEYSSLPKSGLIDIVQSSNRKLKLSDHISIPVIFPSDFLTEQAKKDKIESIPFSGYYIRIIIEGFKQKVLQVSMLF